jgi:hypothetical protein
MNCGNDHVQSGATRSRDLTVPADASPMSSAGSVMSTDVIVVGGGVSGCACAAVLAAGGARVLVVSSALDVVGLPGYGPVVESPTGEWGELLGVMASLPPGLRRAWLETALIPGTGEAALVVDRRVVSIDSKRALENMPGVQFRQALITGFQPASNARVASGPAGCGQRSDSGSAMSPGEDLAEVESAFGERFAAAAVVLAPGLGLGGVVRVGAETLAGGRYGEVAATSLYEGLVRHGVTFTETEARVGDRYAHLPTWAVEGGGLVRVAEKTDSAPRECGVFESTAGATLSHEVAEVRSRLARLLSADECLAATDRARIPGWPEWFPPAPHLSVAGEARVFICAPDGCGRADGERLLESSGEGSTGRFWPDGAATGEFYLDLGTRRANQQQQTSQAQVAAGSDCGPASRLGYEVRALTVDGLSVDGRLSVMGSGVWVAGQAAGCRGYLESLRSGVSVGRDVLQHLIGRGCVRG